MYMRIDNLTYAVALGHKWQQGTYVKKEWGWDGRQASEEGDIFMYMFTYMAESLHCTAETNTIREGSYIPIKNKIK